MSSHFRVYIFSLLLLSSCAFPDDKPKPINPDAPQRVTVEEENPEIPPPPAPYTGPRKFCFEKHGGDNGQDVTTLQMLVTDDNVTGQIDFVPATGPAKHGKVEGLMLGKIFRLTYKGQLNGANYAEELIYKFEDDKLFKRSGEMELRDSIWVFADPFHTKFSLDMEKVDCK